MFLCVPLCYVMFMCVPNYCVAGVGGEIVESPPIVGVPGNCTDMALPQRILYCNPILYQGLSKAVELNIRVK